MSEAIKYQYHFAFENGKELDYDVVIDSLTLISKPLSSAKPPSWAKLECEKCPNCTLDSDTTYCPVAEKISPIVDDWNDVKAEETVRLTVDAGTRVISGNSTAQKGLVSFLGLLIASSACPHTKFLAPMCRTHLPLASTDESMFRMASYYVMAKFFSGTSDQDIGGVEDLVYLVENLQSINTHLSKRLQKHQKEDASVDAITMLHALSTTLPTSIQFCIEQLQQHVLPVSDQLDGASISLRLQSLQF